MLTLDCGYEVANILTSYQRSPTEHWTADTLNASSLYESKYIRPRYFQKVLVNSRVLLTRRNFFFGGMEDAASWFSVLELNPGLKAVWVCLKFIDFEDFCFSVLIPCLPEPNKPRNWPDLSQRWEFIYPGNSNDWTFGDFIWLKTHIYLLECWMTSHRMCLSVLQ